MMKSVFLWGALSLSVIAIYQRHLLVQDITTPHGGKMKKIDSYKVEIVDSSDSIFVYLYDKDLNPYSNRGITGNVVFVYEDSTIVSAELSPYNKDGFTAKVVVPNYYICNIYLDIQGKKISTQFNTKDSIARNGKENQLKEVHK